MPESIESTKPSVPVAAGAELDQMTDATVWHTGEALSTPSRSSVAADAAYTGEAEPQQSEYENFASAVPSVSLGSVS